MGIGMPYYSLLLFNSAKYLYIICCCFQLDNKIYFTNFNSFSHPFPLTFFFLDRDVM